MQPNIPHEFESALRSFGIDNDGQKPTETPYTFDCGEYRLVDNVNLTREICDVVAEKTKSFWTFSEYLRLQNTTPEKPIEPLMDDPVFDPQNEKYGSPLERKVVRVMRYKKAHAKYEKRYQSYQKLLLQIRTLRAAGKFDVGGYLDFVVSTLQVDWPEFVQDFFFTPKVLRISEKSRQSHTFVTGGTGAGKSETIKTIIRHYLTKNTKPAIVLLDPHGDLAYDVARFRENYDSDRLVYIRPGYFEGQHISFNPFEINDMDEVSLNRAQMQFLGAIEQIIDETLTRPQRALLTPCIGVLLHKKGSTFTDLVRFMDDNRSRDLVEYGKTYLPNKQDKDFFQHQFYSRNFESTKEALRYRFGEIIRDPTVREFLCNDSTFNIPECLEAGKVIVFHFNPDYHTHDPYVPLVNSSMPSYQTMR